MSQSVDPEVPSTGGMENACIRYLPVIAHALRTIDRPETATLPDPLLPEHLLTADIGLASLDLMKLTLALEEALDIEVAENGEFGVETLGDLCLRVDSWVAAQHGPTR